MALDGTVRLNTSTLNGWIYRVIEPLFRESILLGLLKAKGRIKYGSEVAAKSIAWNVSWMRRRTSKITGTVQSLSFPNTSTEVQCSLGWSGRGMGESISELERLINASAKTRIYDLVEHTIGRLSKDFTEDYRLFLWQDGNQTTNDLMGIMSMFGASTTPMNGVYSQLGSYTPLTPTGGTTAGGNTSWWFCQPTSAVTYAGQRTDLGYKVNDWVAPTYSAFPVGQGSYGYNYYTPTIIDYNSKVFSPDNPTGLSTPTHSWQTQFSQAANRMMATLKTLQGVSVDAIICDPELLAQAKDSTLNKQRFVVEDTPLTRDTGLEILSYNGAKFASEYGGPPGGAFAITVDKLNLYSLHKQLIGMMEDDDIVTAENLHRLSAYTQMWAESPAFFGALVPATAAGSGT